MNFDLSRLFSPTSIAVVGASNRFDRLGYHVMKSLVGNYRGTIYPVNARGEKIWDIDSYSSLTAISDDIDLAIVAVPAPSVIETLHACGQKNVKGIVLITAGFKEIEDPEGRILEDKIREIAARYNLPIIGPNTFGFVNLNSQVNASFTSEFSAIEKGGVALVSQSGGICHLCGFLAIQQGVAMSTLMSLGNRCNVDFTEVLKYLVEEDNSTRVIALYIEGLDEPRKLLNTAELLRGGKPII
ncbi:MAG TPA: CoA-binding protein, partial [Syntrophorhabdaceae bacterium]|nr:CoA-binding protein [Syntrophorhabdaceae bacterium]